MNVSSSQRRARGIAPAPAPVQARPGVSAVQSLPPPPAVLPRQGAAVRNHAPSAVANNAPAMPDDDSLLRSLRREFLDGQNPNVSGAQHPNPASLIEPPPVPFVYWVVTVGERVGIFHDPKEIDFSRVPLLPRFNINRFDSWKAAKDYYTLYYNAGELLILPYVDFGTPARPIEVRSNPPTPQHPRSIQPLKPMQAVQKAIAKPKAQERPPPSAQPSSASGARGNAPLRAAAAAPTINSTAAAVLANLPPPAAPAQTSSISAAPANGPAQASCRTVVEISSDEEPSSPSPDPATPVRASTKRPYPFPLPATSQGPSARQQRARVAEPDIKAKKVAQKPRFQTTQKKGKGKARAVSDPAVSSNSDDMYLPNPPSDKPSANTPIQSTSAAVANTPWTVASSCLLPGPAVSPFGSPSAHPHVTPPFAQLENTPDDEAAEDDDLPYFLLDPAILKARLELVSKERPGRK